MKYSEVLYFCKQAMLKKAEQTPVNNDNSISYRKAFELSTGDPQYIENLQAHVKKFPQHYAQFFTPESIKNFTTKFNPDDIVERVKGKKDQWIPGVSTQKEGLILPQKIQLSYFPSNSIKDTQRNYLQRPHPWLPRAITSNAGPTKSALDMEGALQIADTQGHQFTHALMNQKKIKNVYGDTYILQGNPNTLKLYQPTGNWKYSRNENKTDAASSVARFYKLQPQYYWDSYAFGKPVQMVQAQNAINRGRNFLKNMFLHYPTSFLGVDQETRRYLMNMPSHWQNKEQAKDFFKRVNSNDALWNALPVQAKRGIGNKNTATYRLLETDMQLSSMLNQQPWLKFMPTKEYKDKLQLRQYLQEVVDYYNKAWILTNNNRTPANQRSA